MSIFFFHRNIIKFANRPFSSVEEMNYQLIANHNKLVGQYDHVYHLGDFGFAPIDKLESVLSQLNGLHHLILGNHDKEIINNQKRLLDAKLFQTIQPYKTLTINKQFIVLFHYGCRVWDKSHYGSWHLFGHSHNSLPAYRKSVDQV